MSEQPTDDQAPDDRAIEHAVVEELEWAPHVDAAGIQVAVHDGVVRLTGHVRTLAEAKAAERTAWHVGGVHGVTAELEVRRPAAHAHDDAEIARRAADVLVWDSRLPGGHIAAAVHDGVVTLSGTVDWQYQRADAETRVQHLAGVVGVDNRIEVRTVPAADEEIREKVLRALHRHAELDAAGIEIAVVGGCVTMSGSVPGFGQRHTAENAAWSARGVNEVVDRMRVVRPPRPRPAT